MHFRVLFHPNADKEYKEAYRRYEEQLEGLGDRFEKTVDFKLGQISSRPFLYSKKTKLFREVKIDTFPYQIVYKVYEKEKVLFICAIHHTSRNPKKIPEVPPLDLRSNILRKSGK